MTQKPTIIQATEAERQLVYNAVKCKQCNTLLVSYTRYDYKTCGCPNQAMVDGGLTYKRYGALSHADIELISIYADDDFEIVRKFATRGSRGKNGDEDLKWVPVCEMSDEYLAAVLEYGGPAWHLEIMTKELQYRHKHGISINET